MKYVIYLLGLTWIAAGAAVILYTEEYKAFFRRMLTEWNPLWLALVPAVVGLLLVMGAGTTSHGGIIILIGIIGIAKGVLIYFNPGNILQRTRTWVERLSDQGYRLAGIIGLLLGTVIISWIQ